MRDPSDIETIAILESEVAKLTAQVARLRGTDSHHHRLRAFGFNPKGSRVMVAMARQSPAVLPRISILETMGTYNEKSATVLMCKLRKVIETRKLPGYIETVQREGYRLDPKLTSWVLRIIDESDTQLPLFPDLT